MSKTKKNKAARRKTQKSKQSGKNKKLASVQSEEVCEELREEVTAVPDSDFALEVRASSVHGKGVFATKKIGEGELVITYTGEIISWEEADERHPHNPDDPNHTFYFALENDRVIDGAVNGNDARWINHSCEPNCEAVEDEESVDIYTVRKIKAGEELTYDYGLIIDDPITDELKADYACRCGSIQCRGTMLANPVPDDLDGSDETSEKHLSTADSEPTKKKQRKKRKK